MKAKWIKAKKGIIFIVVSKNMMISFEAAKKPLRLMRYLYKCL